MQTGFKKDQKRYPRVRGAYSEKDSVVKEYFAKKNITFSDFSIYLRAFKEERKIEVWAKNNSDSIYTYIKDYKICSSSGSIGPKRKYGDLQVPEGFYHIDRFNPYSNFHLSLGLNYPNTSDRILGEKGNLGGDIFIHGSCVTIGCLPITDDKIKELYIICVEAKNSGQEKIPVVVFPTELTDEKYSSVAASDTKNKDLWFELKQAFDYFNKTKRLPKVVFLSTGRHKISSE